MSRSDVQRFRDIIAACEAIESHLAQRGVQLNLVFDGIRIRLVEIGEAVKDIDPATLASEPDIPWQEIARMRDQLAHRYFDTTHSIVDATARRDIPRLKTAVQRLIQRNSK